MSRGLSPIIATMLLIGIAIAVGSILSIWISSQSIEYMNIEGDRRERILDKEGESLTLVHVELSGGNATLTVQNNGTTDLDISYVKFNGSDYHPYATPIELRYGQTNDLTQSVSGSLSSVEIGTSLGSIFVFNAPSPQIRVLSTFFDENNKLVTFSGEGSTDDGYIVQWNWCFNWDETNKVCKPNCDPSKPGLAEDTGAVTSYSYLDLGSSNCPAGPYVVRLVVVDNTGMTGEVLITIIIP